MCGIAGRWATSPLEDHRSTAVLGSLQHRGPDAHGSQTMLTPTGRYLSMLFTRLSIIDLDERSNQPMHSDGVWLVLNGEIYNYREVRARLESTGTVFRTLSDTEVLLEGYRRFGWAILDQLEGMWAFALYDTATGQLSLCRDRFGEKPLYFHKSSSEFVFASEVNALSQIGGLRINPNHEQIRRFLVNGYKSLYGTSETFFTGVEEVPAGSVLHIQEAGSTFCVKYWSPALDIDEGMTFVDAVTGTRQRLRDSVELRLRSDVPLAFSLSGGIDSVALVSVARRELGSEVNGFTILNSDPRYEERDLVHQVVSELGIHHTAIELNQEHFLSQLRQLVIARAAPVLTVTYYVQWLLMREVARQGFKVVVGGTGADEIFSGYYDHHLLYIASVSAEERVEAITAWESAMKPFVRNPYLQDPNRFVHDPGFRDHISLDADRFATYVPWASREVFAERDFHPVLLRNRMLNELFHESVPVILHEEDLNAMSFSIENRSPYLDRHLMEFAFAIPTRLLIRNGRAKAVLREAVRGLAPDAILDNPRKVGFNAPIGDLLDLNSANIQAQILADSPIYDIVNRQAIKDLLHNYELRNSESKFLFAFLGCKFFLEEFS